MTTATQAPPPAPPARTGRAQPTGSAPLRLIRAELLKIFTTNSWWIIGILVLACTALALSINLLIANEQLNQAEFMLREGMPDFGAVPPGTPPEAQPSPEQIEQMQRDWERSSDVDRVLLTSSADVFTSGQFLVLLFMVVLGALIVTNEFYHQTATATFLTTPHRSAVILAKLAAAAIFGIAFWAVVTAVDVGVGAAYFGLSGYDVLLTDWPVVRSILMNLLAFVIWVILGVGFGVLIRNQLGATITGGALYLVSFPVAFTFFGLIRAFVIKEDWVWNWMVSLPGVASNFMIRVEPMEFEPGVFGPSWWVAALVLIGYAVVASVVGTLITRKRDIS
jgi:ABC-2 type transport system permease protein